MTETSPPLSLLARVRERVRRGQHPPLQARRPVVFRDTGGHLSRHRERSLDIDDLREYVIGDDIGDIDWKATARAGHPLVRRYIAQRQTAVLVVADTGSAMAALADATTAKWEVAVTATAIVGDAAMANGDTIGLVAAGPRPLHIVPRRGDAHLEAMLRTLRDTADLEAPPSQLADLLRFVATEIRRRALVVVVAAGPHVPTEPLRRLAERHDVLYSWVDDATLTDPHLAGLRLRAVGGAAPLPRYFQPRRRQSRHRGRIHDELRAAAAARARSAVEELTALGIAGASIGAADPIGDVVRLLSTHRHFTARR